MSSQASDTDSDFVLDREDGWQDVEPDNEDLQIVSLLDDKKFTDVKDMIEHCKTKYDFDFVAITTSYDLDFYARVKLVNYIRSEVKRGHVPQNITSTDQFDDEKYLQPVLEDDALLFCLDELYGDSNSSPGAPPDPQPASSSNRPGRRSVSSLELELETLRSQFAEYRNRVEETLDKRWEEAGPNDMPAAADKEENDRDHGYFDSYSYNEIHETMLKDSIRTDAYRDFIYENKHLFRGKTVLDVGCGTGILSMFCAKAGASKVIAVDNSAIIEKARANVFTNKLSDTIVCVRGKIEEVELPVKQVDIIVSEWMGYCLLFEAMLDSVIWARDKYLAPDGLMVPSHCALHIAPLVDPDYVEENIEFWYDIYGFDMSAMMEKIYDDVLIRQVEQSNLASLSHNFFLLPLHDVKVKDLTFSRRFKVILSKDVENLNGWVVWFDTFFLKSRKDSLAEDARAEEWAKKDSSAVAFTTGPAGKETHWRSAVMIIDKHKKPPIPLKESTALEGTVSYKKPEGDTRGLEIDISWRAEDSTEHGQQKWIVR